MQQVKRDMPAREVRTVAFEVRAAGDDGLIEGYGSVFGTRDAYDDVIVHGAFAQTLAEHKASGTMPAMLWQHDPSSPIGAWTEITEDERGLRVVGRLALKTARGMEARELSRMGALNGLSIGFVTKDADYDHETDIRTIKAIDLWEVSMVTFPANRSARITQVKASPDEILTPKDAERTLREAGFSRSDATAIVARLLRMGGEQREAADCTALVVGWSEFVAQRIQHGSGD